MKRVPVLIIAHYYAPLRVAGTERALAFARFLPEFGFQPIVLTSSRYGDSPDDAANFIFRAGDLVDTLFRPWRRRKTRGLSAPDQFLVPTVSNTGLLGRLRDRVMVPDTKIGGLWPALALGRRLIRDYQPALIFSTSPPETTHLVARSLSRESRLPWVADLRDGWLFEPPNPQYRQGQVRRAIEGHLEAATVASTAAVVTATEPIAADLRRRYPQASARITTVTNGYDPKEFVSLARRRSPDGTFLLTHTGALLGSRQGTSLEAFFAGVAQFQGANPVATLRIQVIGDVRADEQDAARAAGLDGVVKFMPGVTREEAHQYQLDADALLLITAPGQRSVATLKLFDYIGAGVPILALADGNAAAKIVREYSLGVTVRPDDPAGIAHGLSQLIERHRAGATWPGFAAAQRVFDRRRLTGDLAALFEVVLSRGAVRHA